MLTEHGVPKSRMVSVKANPLNSTEITDDMVPHGRMVSMEANPGSGSMITG